MTSPQQTEKTGGQIEAEHLEWSRQQPAKGGCLFCPDFRPEGTCQEVQDACNEHRARVHPELSKKKRKRRPTYSGILVFSQNLTEDERAEVDQNRARRLRLLGISE